MTTDAAAAPPAEPARRRRRLLVPLAALLVLAVGAAAAVVVLREDAADGPGAIPVAAVSFPVATVAEGASDDLGRSWQQAPVEDPDGLIGPSERPRTLAAGPDGLVAMGIAGSRDVVWTSPDGSTWIRRALDPDVFTRDDSVSAVRAGPEGYLAVGASYPTSQATRGVLWTSPDGQTWTRRTAVDLGIAPPDGRRGDEFTDVAFAGRTVVIAGGEFDQTNDDAKDTVAFWRSTDGGARFERAPTELKIGGTGSRSFVRSLVASGGAFHALGSGGVIEQFDDYDPVLLSSPDGLRWSRSSDRELAGKGEDLLQQLTSTAGGALIGVGTSDEAPLVVAGRPGSLRRAAEVTAALRERPIDLTGVAVIGDVTVAVGDIGATGDEDALVVRRQAAAPLARVPLPEVDALAEATVTVGDVVAGPDGLLASGSAGGDAAVWSSTDGLTWAIVPLPAQLAGGPRGQALDGIVLDEDGTGWTAAGSRGGELAGSALLLRSEDGTTVTEAPYENLSLTGENAFADRILLSAAVRGKTTVVVGWSDDGNLHQSALALRTGPDGTFNDQAESATRPESGDVFDEDAVDAVRGGPGLSRVMRDVASARSGFLAVGHVGTGIDEPSVPATWVSTEGARWGLQPLPLPQGTESGGLTAVAAAGDGWVAVGTVAQGDRDLPYAWAAPQGTTWTEAALPLPADRSGLVEEVVVTPAGTVALGSTSVLGGPEDGQRDAAAWISRDGATWEVLDLPGLAGGDGQQSLATAALLGDTVVALGSTVTKVAVQTLVVRLRPEDLAPATAS